MVGGELEMDESEESPLDLVAELSILESKTSSDEQVLNVYVKLSQHIRKQLSIFELDFVEQGRRLLTVTKKHVTSDREFKNSITPKALNVMSYCVGLEEINRSLTSAEISELVMIWNKIIAETKEKSACAFAFRCFTNQKFTNSTMDAEIPRLMNAFSRAGTLWLGKSTLVEFEAMHTIQRFGEQCPRTMMELCDKWGPLYLRLLVSKSPKVQELAYSRLLKWTNIMASSKGFMRTGFLTVTQQIVPDLKIMFQKGQENYAMKSCMLLLRIFKQELNNITLLNSLLTIQEIAFRCSSSEIRCQAFRSWVVLIEILDEKDLLKKHKFVELIMRVFKTHNANTEEIALVKLSTWWRYVQHMGPFIWRQFDQILRPLLQFCLGNSRLGSESGSSSVLRAIHSPSGDPASGLPGSPVVLPVFPKAQQGGLDILAFMFHGDGQPPTSLLELEPLKNCPIPLDVFIKNARFLISAVADVTKLFATTKGSQVVDVWVCTTDFILSAVIKDRDESNSAVSSFLAHFQALIESRLLPSNYMMKLFRLVCSLPPDVLSAPSLIDGSIFKCRAHSLCELLLSSSLLDDCGHMDSYETQFMKLVNCGIKNPAATLPFLESIGKLLDTRATSMPSVQVLWDLWKIVANKLQDYMLSTNQVDQDDRLEPNFGCLYTALLLPVTHLLGPKVSKKIHKTLMKTLVELYHTFARLAALVTTARANVTVEEFSQKILSKVSADSYNKDLLTLGDLAELCQAMVADFDFSFLDTANPFMKGIRTSTSKHRTSSKPLGNLHSFVCLLAQLVSWVLAHVEQKEDKPAAEKQKGSEGSKEVGNCCGKLIDVLIKLVNKVYISSLISHLVEKLIPPLAALFTAVPKKLPEKACSPVLVKKLDCLWQGVFSMLTRHYKGHYDSDMLHHMAPVLQAAFTHSRRTIRNQTMQLWNDTFGKSTAPLTYPADLQDVLAKTSVRPQLSLPGLTLQDVVVIDDTPFSQTSLSDSQVSELRLPGMTSPSRLHGSFLNKNVSPKPGTSTSAKILPRSENRRSASSARKKLPLECLPQKDFVVITDTPHKRRILTEHQKEVFQERRYIPAMYNSLETSQDMNLMAHFSSDSTQQDSPFDKPTADSVIVVNASPSQDLLQPKQTNTDQPSEELSEPTKLPAPRRSSRLSSVQFGETEGSKPEFKIPVVKKTLENKREIFGLSESLSQDTGQRCEDQEKSLSQKSRDQEKSLSLPSPQPNVMADDAERLIASSSGDTSQSVVSLSTQSSDEKRENRSAQRTSSASQRSSSLGLEKSSSRQSRSRKDSQPQKRRTRSQGVKGSAEEEKSSPEVVQNSPWALKAEHFQRRTGSPYTTFKHLLQKCSPEDEDNGEKNSNLTDNGMGICEKALKNMPELTKTQPAEHVILVEESSSPQERVTKAVVADMIIKETPTKTSPTTVEDVSATGLIERSRKSSVTQHLIQPVLDVHKAPHGHSADSSHSGSFTFPVEDSPDRFILHPPVICDEVASQGFPVGLGIDHSSNVESSSEGNMKGKEFVGDKVSRDHQERSNTLLDQHAELGFSGLLASEVSQDHRKRSNSLLGHLTELRFSGLSEQNFDHVSNGHKGTDSVVESEDDISVYSEASYERTYDPQLTATLRTTPLPRRSSRFKMSEKTNSSGSQKESVGGGSQKESVGGGSSKDISLPVEKYPLLDTPAIFDPTKDSTLGETTKHTRKRKQQTPKKISDPSLLRHTSRRKLEKRSASSCSKTKARSHSQTCSRPAEKLCKKQNKNGLPSAPSSKPPAGRLLQQSVRRAKQQVSTALESKKNKQNKTRKENLKTKPVDRSPQELGEVTPETKTSCTPLRRSTTERKKKAAKRKSTLKSLGPTVDDVLELDGDDSNHASYCRSASKPKTARRDVFDSKKEKDKSEYSEIDVCGGIDDIIPSSTALKKSLAETSSNVRASKLKLKRSAAQKLSKNVRSPPRLRLRQKKKAISDEGKNRKTNINKGSQQETRNGSDSNHVDESGKVKDSDEKVVGSVLTSKKARLGKDTDNRSSQKKKVVDPVPLAWITSCTAAVLTPVRKQRMTRRGRGGMTRNPLKKNRNCHQSLPLSPTAVSEEGSEEVVIEQYESNQCIADEADQGKAEDPLLSDAELPVSRDISSAGSQCLQPLYEDGTDMAAESSELGVLEDRDKNTVVSANPQNTDHDQGPDADMSIEGSEEVMPDTPEEDKRDSKEVMPDTPEEAKTDSEEVIPDTHEEAKTDSSTSLCTTSVDMQLSHIDSLGSNGVEGSEDMFDNDDDQETSPLLVPFSRPVKGDNDDGSVSENKEINDITKSSSLTEEGLEMDFPHNQRGLEVEQGSLTPVVVNDDAGEDTNEDMVDIVQNNVVGTSVDMTSDSEMADKVEEGVFPTAIPSVQATSPVKENQAKSCERKLSKTELFKLIDESDATVGEIMEYLQNKSRNKEAFRKLLSVPGGLDEPPEAVSSGMGMESSLAANSASCVVSEVAAVFACTAVSVSSSNNAGASSCPLLTLTATGGIEETAHISGGVQLQSQDCSSVGADILDGVSTPSMVVSTSTCVSVLEAPPITTTSEASSHTLSSLFSTSAIPQSSISKDQPESSTSIFSQPSSGDAACASKVTPDNTHCSTPRSTRDSAHCSTPRSARRVLWDSSLGILKRPFDNSEEDPETPSKVRRVCFANPVEVGETPTCEECGGIPSCEKCLEDCKWYRRHKETCSLTPRRRARSWKRKRKNKRIGLSRLMLTESPRKGNIKGGPGERNGSPGNSLSQWASENASPNSYHSTQESQLDCADPVFPELVDCTEDFGAVLGGLTISAFGLGMKNILLSRGVKTVGHLASLTEKDVEKLPMLKPKTETLKNVLKQYLQQNPSASSSQKNSSKATEPDGSESLLARKGIPTSSFYKKSSKSRKPAGTSDWSKRQSKSSEEEFGPSHGEVSAPQEKGDGSLFQKEAAQPRAADRLGSFPLKTGSILSDDEN